MALEMDIRAAAEQRDDLPDAENVHDCDDEIPITDLFDTAFVQANTEFESFDDLVAASPSDADSAAKLETVSHGEWDEFVAETTDFEDEKELVMAARDHWIAEKLDLN
ncbi:hypothetical protein ACFOZ7_03570 [Natribaculum luteum]|uniref:Uncharacterized protein n=1 Tax=Natribaculum luteum TaxID=1586232 RepID=A0ABD5NVG5_9EURY|nr:hypothetical protein [Natribaculum luteum]